MSLDSTAELLFHIGADSDEAEENIQRFRALLGKDLDDIREEFAGWAEEVFGELKTVEGALTALTATAAAAAVGIGGLLMEATQKYEEYVGEVVRASQITGISTEHLSGMASAAKLTGVSMETLTRGLTMFEASVVKANEGSQQQALAFDRLGITERQIADGERNIMPLLEAVMDRFKGLASGTERAAIARDLFSRGGAEMMAFLNLGSEGLRKMEEEAAKLGLAVGDKDKQAFLQSQAAMNTLKETMEAFSVAIGREVLPYMTKITAFLVAMPEMASKAAYVFTHLGEIILNGMTMTKAELDAYKSQFDFAEIVRNAEDELNKLAEVMAANGEGGKDFLAPMEDGVDKLTAAERKYIDHIQEETKKFIEEQDKAEGKMLAGARKLYEAQQADAFEQAGALLRLRGMIDQLQHYPRHVEPIHMDQSFDQMKQSIKTVSDEEARLAERFDAESKRMAEAITRVQRSHETAYERLAAEYQEDLARYGYAEEAKAVQAVKGTGREQQVEEQFAAMRAALLTKYGNDLQQLYNSTGWHGVFGSKFGEMLKGNEALMREWATSADQALLLVRNSFAMLGQQGRQAFDQFADGMGQGIAQAIVYSKSITQAMRATVAATLESIAAKDLVLALDATAWGFYDLAMGDYAGAAAAFEAAALFGVVGGAAAVAGRFAAPSSQTGAGSQQGRAGAAAGGYSGGPGASAPIQQAGPGVHVYVQGNLVGWNNIDELASAINDAVLNRDVTLTATNTTTGVQVVHG